MATAGYSGTPLLKKLGIKDDTKLFTIHAPADYTSLLDKDISLQLCKKATAADMIHLFAANEKVFTAEMGKLKKAWTENTSLTIWISWYKKSAGMNSDLTEDIIRNYALANGLVDVKVCAVTDLWSGLKLVVPLVLRNKK
ncbi:MAG: hypothetical protein QM726_06600 [Chitinophagaceae bacterium]